MNESFKENNNEMAFTVVSPIVTKARPRARVVKGAYAQVYTPNTTVNYENLIKLQYEKQCKNHFFGDVPLHVNIIACFTVSEANKKYVEFGYGCTNHKDLDNIAKTVLDALNGIAYKDDKQVVSLMVSKHWTTSIHERIRVFITPINKSLEEAKECYKKSKIKERLKSLYGKEKLSKAEMAMVEKLERTLAIDDNN